MTFSSNGRARGLVFLNGCLALALSAPARHAQCDLTEAKKLVAGDASTLDYFGVAVATDGATAIVGAWKDDSAAASAGSAYIFGRDVGGAGNWGQVKKLTASDAAANDFFGGAVAISGDVAVVGAWGDDDAGPSTGSAYVFHRDAGGANNWGQVLKLTASDAGSNHQFGRHMAISGDTLVVTSQGFAVSKGAMYVFERNFGGLDNWGEVAQCTASDGAQAEYFGISVGIDGDSAIVGAYGHDGTLNNIGAAYVFERDLGGPDNWGESRKLTASDADLEDQFGSAVAIEGDSAIVAANFEDSGGSNAGAVYFFERDLGGPDNWGEVVKHVASDAGPNDQLSESVAIAGDVALAATIQTDGGGASSGSAYIFRRDHGGANFWGEAGVLTASDAAGGDNYGAMVALSGDTAIAGAPLDKDAGVATGSAYISSMGAAAELVRLGTPPNPLAFLPGVTTAPVLGATWDPVIDHTAFLPAAVLDVVGITVTSLNVAVPPLGTLLCDPATTIVTVTSAPGVPFAVPIPLDCMFAGAQLCSQGASIDAAGNLRLANALDITLGMN